MKKFVLQALTLSLLLFAVIFLLPRMSRIETPKVANSPLPTGEQISPSPIPLLTITPTPQPELSFSEMNARYGPCAIVPTLFYHHIENIDQAKTEGHKWMAVAPEAFRSQMEYLKNHGYASIGMQDLINFFDQGTALPHKPILLTFDDGYDDVGKNAVPILEELGLNATLFIPSGLIDNPGYLTWNELENMPSSIERANHTWSHHNVLGSRDIVTKEIGSADRQLSDHGMNEPKVFAYPYGPSDALAQEILTSFGYKLAFTTAHGSIACKQKRLELPRIRIGNTPLSTYGL